ncbi:hypothetical protein [Enterobacter hormaechei]|uniref:hypothetical protein n=3 Tax=Enterobacteriaceae TaxID=543 RepID=UPI00187F36CC|nr:hypothetical protein [Enterobacter hormaechei]MBE9458569.1 hypothetical protein [Enterobacter hormaechei]MBF1967669.1 hypothetical protein [Enterobacter hormaechei]MBF9187199.1 hypothetical protein [Enterobacter hormaechei]
MFGKLLKSVSWQIRAELQRSLKSNRDYKKLRWNPVERILVSCSTHYIRAMLVLWSAAFGAVGVVEYFRPVLQPFALQYFKGITSLSDWMSNLLGSQLTIIGIVFPLVVGLISVLFQKKSARIHIQSAYQLHSGYMFAGLSGLSLAAFIVLGGMTLSIGDGYLNTSFAVTAFVWMLFNIFLSIWFFVSSLNVLDENKRDRLLNKYFLSQVVDDYIQKSYILAWLRYPGVNIGENYLDSIKILPYSLSEKEGMTHVKFDASKSDVIVDVYIRPLLFLLRRLKAVDGQDAEIVILPSFGVRSGELALLSSKGVKPVSGLWRWLLRRCIITGYPENKRDLDDITFDFFGEAYDALNDKNISVFRTGIKRLTDTYTSIKRSYNYGVDKNYLDEVKESGFSHTFSDSFHYELRKFFRESVKSTEYSGEYFRESMTIPLHVYRKTQSTCFTDFRQFLLSLFRVWHVLNKWKAGLGGPLSASQELTHQALIREYIGMWEGWSMSSIIGKPGSEDSTDRLMYHLHNTARLLIPSVVADNASSVRYAHDVLCLWMNQRRFSRHWEEEYRWHSFFLTPDYLSLEETDSQWAMLLRGRPYKKDAALSIMFANALSDFRLLIAGYIIAHFEPQKNIDLADLVNHLIMSELYEDRDTHDTLTPAFRCSVDIIDMILRIEHCNLHTNTSWYSGLSETIEVMNSFNERSYIPGRVYTGVNEDIGSLYGAFSLLAIKLARPAEQVTQRVNEALAGRLFSYFSKERIISILERLKRDPSAPYEGYIISEADYATNVVFFNDVLDKYIDVFNRSKTADIVAAEVDQERLRNTDTRLTNELPGALTEDVLLKYFTFTQNSECDRNWLVRYIPVSVSRDYVARELNQNVYEDFPSVSEVKRNILHRLHYELWKSQAKLTMEVNHLETLLMEVAQRSADQKNYILVIYGSRFNEELRELIHQSERHDAFSIHVDVSARGSHSLPFRINNCLIYLALNSEQEFSLMVSTESFGELRLFRYPDGTLFNTFYRSNGDPLEGVMKTLWEMEMEITDAPVVRFEHR